MSPTPSPSTAGIPPGSVETILAILRQQPGPMRRRKLLEALDQRGHRISLAGLNRALQYCKESGLTLESEDGVRLPTSK
jgi:Fe2+ or Zn2+ uptake regulation protein